MPDHPMDSLEADPAGRPARVERGRSMGVKLAGALKAAHRAGIVHRDVKPANILVSDYGEPELTDFGIARIAGAFQTRTGVTGSPAFAAPEVLERRPPCGIGRVRAQGDDVLRDHRPCGYERRSGEQVVAQFLRITSQPIPDRREQGLPSDVRPPSNTPWLVIPGPSRLGGGVWRAASRHSEKPWEFVDEMAHTGRVGVKVARRRQCRQPIGAHPTPTPPSPYEVPPCRRRHVAGCSGSARRYIRAAGRRRLILINAPSG